MKIFKNYLFWSFLAIAGFIVLGIYFFASYKNPININYPSTTSSSQQISGATPGSCLIVEEKYCGVIQIISNPNYPTGLFAVASLPAGTPIFAPESGFYSNTPTFSFKKNDNTYASFPGVSITVADENKILKRKESYSFMYYNQDGQFTENKIVKGNVIGKLSDKKIDFLGDYNLVFAATKHPVVNNESTSEPDNDKLRQILNIK